MCQLKNFAPMEIENISENQIKCSCFTTWAYWAILRVFTYNYLAFKTLNNSFVLLTFVVFPLRASFDDFLVRLFGLLTFRAEFFFIRPFLSHLGTKILLCLKRN